MAKIEDHVFEIEQHLAKGHGEVPQSLLLELLQQMGPHELREWNSDLRKVIDRFQLKRRSELTAELDRLIARGLNPRDLPLVKAEVEAMATDNQADAFERELRRDLRDLRDNHIFAWSTSYRELLVPHFDELLPLARSPNVVAAFKRALSEHSHEIFQRGYAHVTTQKGATQGEAVQKASSGLARFLDLPVEFYSTRATTTSEPSRARELRTLGSALIFAIVEGYGACNFGNDDGWELLAKWPSSWAHYIPFLTGADATIISQGLGSGQFARGVADVALPLVKGLDELIARPGQEYLQLPVLGQLIWDQRRLEVALRPPPDAEDPRLIEIHAYLDEGYVNQAELLASLGRGVSVIVTPLKADVEAVVKGNSALSKAVVAVTSPGTADPLLALRVANAIENVIYERRSPRAATNPLAYNFAEAFPLRSAFLTKYFHVPRTSVRDSLRVFERRNGVRLWCSVRRSGKTTACFDLGSTTGSSTVVSQTCDSTEQFPGAHVFYDEVVTALELGAQLPKDFFSSVVERCAPLPTAGPGRVVFVIDEYETLFGKLKSDLRVKPELRYNVVQPLLNQMVGFTQSNLLVFMGQQPDAHNILMDQNQLSAYVEQDAFPLFQHHVQTTSGEFSELVRKVLTDRIMFDAGFADALYVETMGHPFLTVNLLVEFVDWLIERKVPARHLRLRAHHFDTFALTHLQSKRIRLSSAYDFFRSASSHALHIDAAESAPWLHAIYSLLRALYIAAPETLSVTPEQFENLAQAVVDTAALDFTPDELLRTGSQANFFAYDNESVRPRIRLLARIVGAVRPRVRP